MQHDEENLQLDHRSFDSNVLQRVLSTSRYPGTVSVVDHMPPQTKSDRRC